MELVHIVALLFFTQCRVCSASSSSTAVTCLLSENIRPSEWYENHKWNPSPIHQLTAHLNESQNSVIIRWAISIDSSIRNLTGTWITFYKSKPQRYRCEYEPPFTSELTKLSGIQQLWFSFTVSNVCPLLKYYIDAYNLPTPSPGTGDTYIKMANTAILQWNAQISAVHDGEKVVVIFTVSSVADKYIITLNDDTQSLNTTEERRECRSQACKVELDYTGPCEEDLLIIITAHFKNCDRESGASAESTVDCKISDGSVLLIGVGCVLTLIFILLCCCIFCLLQRCVVMSKRSVSVRVLLVYPAVDAVFQRSVMRLAELLQSRGGVCVFVDVWDSRSVAEQGPLRWINTHTELADRVLIVSPPTRNHDALKPDVVSGMTDHSVSASASNLFTLALNLVSSAAHDPQGRDKFWVISLGQEEKSIQAELRGLRVFNLPRDQEKLHQQLTAGEKSINTCCSTFYVKNALGKMEINTSRAV
ncbi:interleukin-17 receptor B [Danio aesculapii]|uniref:interleukin-17 receptor B n=1 Tax=Danio aesculapii TaxID=1142201 RepID=UPI0024C0131F|nr:interleukin-17 receptor B [Danio aesculapii]